MNIVFDIGANEGSMTLGYLQNKDNMVYAIEPLPDRFKYLKGLEQQYNNLKTFNLAISNEDCFTEFYINYPDVTSSLKKFTDQKSKWDVSQKTTTTIEVQKLKTFIDNNDISGKTISFIKIDTQGSDLDVIKSLGDYILNVFEIQCECFLTKENENLYDGECKCVDIVYYMKENNFEIVSNIIHHSGKWGDITFRNKNLKK